MYIGTTGPRGLHHLVYEVVDNSVDEALQGFCDHIVVTLLPDGRVSVSDNGRGIPVAAMADTGIPALEVVLTKLHAGGKFGGEGYKVSGGLHGVGISVVNALSEHLLVEVRRDGHVWRQEYERGDPLGPLEQLEPTDRDRHDHHLPARRRDLRGDRLLVRHAVAAAPRDGVPDQGPQARAGRRARGRRDRRLPLRGRHPRLHRARQRDQGPRAPDRHLLRERDGRGPGRGRDAVERQLRRVHVLVREQHQHPRGRHAPVRLQGRADAHAERLRAQQGAAQGEGGAADRRRLPRGARRDRVGEAARAAVRGPDQDQAGQPLGPRPGRDDLQRQARPSSSRRTRTRPRRSSTS